MTPLLPRTNIVVLVILFWLFASASGLHGHFCFDGSEPPVSVHFDLLGDNDQDTHSEVGHQDIDSKPVSMTFLKSLSFDLPLLAAALLLFIIWPVVRGQSSAYFNDPSTWLGIAGLRPPLRAPPSHSR